MKSAKLTGTLREHHLDATSRADDMGVGDNVARVDEYSRPRGAAGSQTVGSTPGGADFDGVNPHDRRSDTFRQFPDAIAETAQGSGLRSGLIGKNQEKEQADSCHVATSAHIEIVTLALSPMRCFDRNAHTGLANAGESVRVILIPPWHCVESDGTIPA